MDRIRNILCAILVTTLAGCADAPTAPDDPLFADAPEAAPGLGVIRGVIVDETITPIIDATVTLLGSGEEVQSDDNGAFSFVDVQPGAHFIEVGKPGWSTVQQSVQVAADEAAPSAVRVMLSANPSALPRAVTFSGEGFVQCGAGTPLTIHRCPGLDDQDKSTVTIPAAGDRPHMVQIETQWQSTQPAGDQLYLIVAWCGETCDYGSASSPDRWGSHAEGVFSSPFIARQPGDNRTALQTSINASPGGPANGTGVALDQPFQVYVTYFYNVEPAEGWSFLEDGEYVV